MDNQTKMLLIPCSGMETRVLAEDIYRILRTMAVFFKGEEGGNTLSP